MNKFGKCLIWQCTQLVVKLWTWLLTITSVKIGKCFYIAHPESQQAVKPCVCSIRTESCQRRKIEREKHFSDSTTNVAAASLWCKPHFYATLRHSIIFDQYIWLIWKLPNLLVKTKNLTLTTLSMGRSRLSTNPTLPLIYKDRKPKLKLNSCGESKPDIMGPTSILTLIFTAASVRSNVWSRDRNEIGWSTWDDLTLN